MPQLDYLIFLSQLSWFLFFFFFVYSWLSEEALPQIYEWLWLRERLENWKKTGLKNVSVFKGDFPLLVGFSFLVFPKNFQKNLSFKLKK